MASWRFAFVSLIFFRVSSGSSGWALLAISSISPEISLIALMFFLSPPIIRLIESAKSLSSSPFPLTHDSWPSVPFFYMRKSIWMQCHFLFKISPMLGYPLFVIQTKALVRAMNVSALWSVKGIGWKSIQSLVIKKQRCPSGHLRVFQLQYARQLWT